MSESVEERSKEEEEKGTLHWGRCVNIIVEGVVRAWTSKVRGEQQQGGSG
jgi:hypothetical protein